jgi:hypothetical protein
VRVLGRRLNTNLKGRRRREAAALVASFAQTITESP